MSCAYCNNANCTLTCAENQWRYATAGPGTQPPVPIEQRLKADPMTISAYGELMPWPTNKPTREINGITCDVWTGACACGGWHRGGE